MGAVAEKQAAILQIALKHLPGSQALWLAHMRCLSAAAGGALGPELLQQWEELLVKHPGEWMLWREYIGIR